MATWDPQDTVHDEWKNEARDMQQEFCDRLGDRDWDVIETAEWNVLNRKVGYGVYGPPLLIPSSENKETGYNPEQLIVIEKISHQLVENFDFDTKNIHFACVFVVVKATEQRYSVPVFKCKREVDESCVFVDTSSRKYANWDDYLTNNNLEQCIVCYPTTGKYDSNEDLDVTFGASPACNTLTNVCGVLDQVAAYVGFSATVVGVASLLTIPVAGPIMAASSLALIPTGVYGVTRSSAALYDRATHSQSIGLLDAEARGCWLSIVGSSLGFAQGRMLSSLTNAARAGEVMSQAGRIAFMAVEFGSLAVNGMGIAHGLGVLIDKSEKNELTTLDVFQFSASLLFFTNSAVNFKSADTIIKEVHRDVINSHKNDLHGKARKEFKRQTGKLRGKDELYGNAKVVKGLNRIENSKDLYEIMGNKNVNSNKVRLTEEGLKGTVNVNKNLKIHPNKLLEMSPADRDKIFDSTAAFAKGNISKKQHHQDMKPIVKNSRINLESMRKDTMQSLCRLYGKDNVQDIVVGGKKIFVNAAPHDIDRLGAVLKNTIKNDKTMLEMITKFSETRGCKTIRDFTTNAEYFVADFKDAIHNNAKKYNADLATAKKQPNFDQAKFDEGAGIRPGQKRSDFYKEKAMNMFSEEKTYDRLNERIEKLKQNVQTGNMKHGGFSSDDAAVSHFLKHGNLGESGTWGEQEYFEIAQEIVSTETNERNTTLSQDGKATIVKTIDRSRGIQVVQVIKDGVATIVTAYSDPKFLKKE